MPLDAETAARPARLYLPDGEGPRPALEDTIGRIRRLLHRGVPE